MPAGHICTPCVLAVRCVHPLLLTRGSVYPVSRLCACTHPCASCSDRVLRSHSAIRCIRCVPVVSAMPPTAATTARRCTATATISPRALLQWRSGRAPQVCRCLCLSLMLMLTLPLLTRTTVACLLNVCLGCAGVRSVPAWRPTTAGATAAPGLRHRARACRRSRLDTTSMACATSIVSCCRCRAGRGVSVVLLTVC